ncbi:MAG: hypothetical protein KAF24_02880 [Nitrosopumilaceae archaeon]|nr:hypothetical protein [Nitrosopumilaceae archaeon]
MTRNRYWKLTIDELEKSNYNSDKVLTWDIKWIIKPEKDAKFIGIFIYRNGTPYNYESINGITYYHNNIQEDILNDINQLLKNKYGGHELKQGDRVFLKNSREIYSANEITALARELERKLESKIVITIEFANMSEEEKSTFMLPENKLLPIPGNK